VPLIAQLGTYSLSGHVRKTGKFEIPRDGRYSIMWAIDNAGGVSETGSLKRVELRRAGRTRDFEDERELELETIRPGDLIKVDRRKF
jgi:protein involved in polysaccharide export with SLBB domain